MGDATSKSRSMRWDTPSSRLGVISEEAGQSFNGPAKNSSGVFGALVLLGEQGSLSLGILPAQNALVPRLAASD